MGINNELEEMRQQLAILHNKLEQQTLVNNDLIRRAISDKYKGLTRQRISSTIVAILSMPMLFLIFNKLGLSLAFIIYTELMLIIALIMEYLNHRELNARDFLVEDIRTVSRKFQTNKKNETKRLYISISMLMVFFVWYAFELPLPENMDSWSGLLGVISCAFATVAGIIAAYIIHKRNQKKLQQIENQLSQLED